MGSIEIEAILDEACEDQREALRKFHRTGAAEDYHFVHYDCLSCDRALEALVEMRAGTPEAAAPIGVPRNQPKYIAAFALTVMLGVVMCGAIGYMLVSDYLDRQSLTKNELERLQSRVQFVRMPGRPDMCIAAIQGPGGFGPRFLGAAPCADVSGRYTGNVEISRDLPAYAVIRVRDTDACLAYAEGESAFMIPCGPDD